VKVREFNGNVVSAFEKGASSFKRVVAHAVQDPGEPGAQGEESGGRNAHSCLTRARTAAHRWQATQKAAALCHRPA
jgi:hypothetical protein